MIESIYNSEAHESTTHVLTSVPKNVRQIGKVHDKKKIYVEDYVMTYIKHLGMKSLSTSDMVVFLGQFIKVGECQCIFISGAVEVKDVLAEEDLVFTNETWTNIYDDIKKYFNDVEIVGWCLLRPGLSLEVDDKIRKIHVDNFAGQDKTLLMYDSLERDEAFYIFEENELKRQEGYYIYYEKNTDMQNYMISQKVGKASKVTEEERVVKEARALAQKNKEEKKQLNMPHGLVYGAGVIVAAFVLVFAISALNNSEKMDEMGQVLNVISQNVVKNSENANKDLDGEEKLPVETMPGVNSTLDDNEVLKEVIAEASSVPESTQKVEEEKISKENPANQESESAETKKQSEQVTEKKEPVQNEKKNELTEKTDGRKDSDKDTEQKSVKKDDSKETISENYYVVKEGDTLAGISIKLYGSTKRVKEIMGLNDIEDQNMIITGRKLKLP